jgi:hypothetical protein
MAETTIEALRPFQMFLLALDSPHNSGFSDDDVIASTTYRAEGSTFTTKLTVENLRALVAAQEARNG